MILQVFNLSDPAVFREFSSEYKIYREVYDSGLLGLELRKLDSISAEEIFQIILKKQEICYKNQAYTRESDLFFPGTLQQLKTFAKHVISSGYEDIGYKIMTVLNNYESYNNIKYTLGKKEYSFNKAYVMGILNVTPDSFSDGGLYLNSDEAIQGAVSMIDEGADFIDVGGESTRPGSDPVDAQEEIRRIVPVIEGILKLRPDAVISADTNKSFVAQKALEAGAVIINDISGLSFDPEMVNVIKGLKASVVIMHIKGKPKSMQQKPEYDDVVKDVFEFLKNQTSLAARKGIKNIFIDPGIGFGKTMEHNLKLMKRLDDFKCLGYPLLIGLSRKSFLGKLLDLKIDERDAATAVAETAAVMNGARILRTHNVIYGKYVSKITENII